MKPEKPWILPKIALVFAITFPFAYPPILNYINKLYFLFKINKYGKEILDTTYIEKFYPCNLDILPIIFSLVVTILCLFLKKTTEDHRNAFIAFLISIFLAFTMYVPCTPNTKAREAACLSNMKQLGIAICMYEEDYDYHLPPLNSSWNLALTDYKKDNRLLHCPTVTSSKAPSYTFNKTLAGFNTNKIKNLNEVITLFESKPGKNLFGSIEQLPKYPRHSGGENYAYLDGHVKWIKREELNKSQFQPVLEGE